MKLLDRIFGNKNKFERQTRVLNRYQIMINSKDNTIQYGCYLIEAFSFDQACDEALEQLKSEKDISHITMPLTFFS